MIFCADATKKINIPQTAESMIFDIPYGKVVSWYEKKSLDRMMDQLANVASENCILAVSMDKSQKPRSKYWDRIEKIVVGKSRIEIFRIASE